MLGATGTVELGLRVESRGLASATPGITLVEPVPWQVEPTFDLAGQLDPRLSYDVLLAPRLLLLAGASGGGVGSTAGFYAGSTSLTWRADDRATLTLATSASRGTLAMSALTQLNGPAAASGAVPPGGGSLDPAAGVRTGEVSSVAIRSPFEWRATPGLSLGGTLGWSHSGGIGDASQLLFPTTTTYAVDGHGTLALTPLDGLTLQAGYTRTLLALQGTVGIGDALARWSRRLGPTTSASLGAGVAMTVQEGPAASNMVGGGLTPRVEASISEQAPATGQGLGFSAQLGYGPYVDQFANAVRQRLAVGASLDWRLDPEQRISWMVSGAAAVDSVGSRQGVAASELAGWHRWRDLEAGLSFGGGYQEAQGTVGAVWQWSATLVSRWRQVPNR